MLYSVFIYLLLFSCLDFAAGFCYSHLCIMCTLKFPRGKYCLQHFPNVFDSEILFLRESCFSKNRLEKLPQLLEKLKVPVLTMEYQGKVSMFEPNK